MTTLAAKTNTAKTKVHDSELAAWLSHPGSEERELIVEASVPRRRVRFRFGTDGRTLPADVDSPPNRAAILEELYSYLSELLSSPPTLLRAAGAVAVRASGRDVQTFLEHPLVRSVRANRRSIPA